MEGLTSRIIAAKGRISKVADELQKLPLLEVKIALKLKKKMGKC